MRGVNFEMRTFRRQSRPYNVRFQNVERGSRAIPGMLFAEDFTKIVVDGRVVDDKNTSIDEPSRRIKHGPHPAPRDRDPRPTLL